MILTSSSIDQQTLNNWHIEQDLDRPGRAVVLAVTMTGTPTSSLTCPSTSTTSPDEMAQSPGLSSVSGRVARQPKPGSQGTRQPGSQRAQGARQPSSQVARQEGGKAGRQTGRQAQPGSQPGGWAVRQPGSWAAERPRSQPGGGKQACVKPVARL